MKAYIKTKKAEYLKKYGLEVALAKHNLLVLLPGTLIVALGLCCFLSFSLTGIFSGLILIMLGSVITKLAWRFIKFKFRVERFLKDVEGKIIVGNFGNMHENQRAREADATPQKKILYH